MTHWEVLNLTTHRNPHALWLAQGNYLVVDRYTLVDAVLAQLSVFEPGVLTIQDGSRLRYDLPRNWTF